MATRPGRGASRRVSRRGGTLPGVPPRRLFFFEFARRTTPMLVLSRKPGETIHVGPGTTITVVQVRGHRVRNGIDAPAEVPLVRAELNGLPGRRAAEPPPPRPPPE